MQWQQTGRPQLPLGISGPPAKTSLAAPLPAGRVKPKPKLILPPKGASYGVAASAEVWPQFPARASGQDQCPAGNLTRDDVEAQGQAEELGSQEPSSLSQLRSPGRIHVSLPPTKPQQGPRHAQDPHHKPTESAVSGDKGSFHKPSEFAKSGIKDRFNQQGASAWAGGKEAVCPSPLSLTQQTSSPPFMTHFVEANSSSQSTAEAMTQWAKASSIEQSASADSSTQGSADAMTPFAKSSMSVPHVAGKATTHSSSTPVNAEAMVPFAKSTSSSPVTGDAMVHFGGAANISSPPVVTEAMAHFAKDTSRTTAAGEAVTQSHTFKVPWVTGVTASVRLDHEESASKQSSFGEQPNLWQPENYWTAQEKPLAADPPPPTAKKEKLADEAFRRLCVLHPNDAPKDNALKAFLAVSTYRARQNKNRHDAFGNRLDELPSSGLSATPGSFVVPKLPSHSEPKGKSESADLDDRFWEQMGLPGVDRGIKKTPELLALIGPQQPAIAPPKHLLEQRKRPQPPGDAGRGQEADYQRRRAAPSPRRGGVQRSRSLSSVSHAHRGGKHRRASHRSRSWSPSRRAASPPRRAARGRSRSTERRYNGSRSRRSWTPERQRPGSVRARGEANASFRSGGFAMRYRRSAAFSSKPDIRGTRRPGVRCMGDQHLHYDPSHNKQALTEFADKLQDVPVGLLRHTHDKVHLEFAHGSHKGMSVHDLIADLKNGTTKPSDLTTLVAVKNEDGTIHVVFGNRRLKALKESVSESEKVPCIVWNRAELPEALEKKLLHATTTKNGGVEAVFA